MSSNSVCNHTRDYQIGLPLRGRPILLITCMITDRIGLHSVLLPLLIIKTLLKLHNKILTEIKRKPKEHSSKLLSFKISFSIKHGILI